jgi:hypothetical protein
MKVSPRIPRTLKGLPSVPFSDRKYLPPTSAVYFVLDDDEPIYIGAVSDLKDRWRVHIIILKIRKIPTLRIAWHQVSKKDLFEIESEAIFRFRPKMNHRLGRHSKRRNIKIVNGEKITIGSSSLYLSVK